MNEKKDLYIGQYTRPSEKGYKDWDTLGFNEAKEAFLSVIKSANTPITIGLYGPWGSGKTEMIKAISQELAEGSESEHITLIFDAWKYRNESNLVLPLICSLEKKLLPVEKIKRSIVKSIGSAFIVMVNCVLRNKTGINVGEIKAALNLCEKNYKHYKKYNDKVTGIEKEYKIFIEMVLHKKAKKKLIIFIDNLDRCFPDIVVNLLEDISCFLSIKDTPCVYVLAMDRENVVKAIKNRYKDFDGAHYLEKIVQIGLNMPSSIKSSDQSLNWTYHFMKRYEIAKGYIQPSQKDDPRDKMHKVFEKMSYVFSSEYLSNPRRIERVVNKIIVLEKMGSVSAEKMINDIPILIFLILLKEHFYEVYNNLFYDEDYNDLYKSLRKAKTHFNQNKTLRKNDENRNDNIVDKNINNPILSKYYHNIEDNSYFKFLCHFRDVFGDQNVTEKFKVYKRYLELIG